MALANFTVTTGLTSADDLKITSSSVSTSTTTGALQVTGGVGVIGKLNVGSGISTTTGTFSSQITSTVATGTAPFVVASTTAVTNLKSDWVVTNANMTGPITGTGNVTSITSQTGTGTKFVMDTSPTLVTPNIGVATATSINSLTISTSTGTLTVANGKTLTANSSLTLAGADSKTLTVNNSVGFTGTDNSILTFGGGGTVAYTNVHKLSDFQPTTSAELASVISNETGTGALVFGTSPAITSSLTTPSTSFDLINTTATTVNFAKAATAISIGATTGTTTVNNNLSITGDLTISGTTTTVSSSTVTVNDPLFYLAANNTGDLLDIGVIGRYHNGTINDAHIGFIRSATDKEWKLFSNVTTEPTTTVDLTGATYDNLRIGKLTTTGVNKVTITQPTTGAILSLADNSELATAGAYKITLTATAATSVTLPTSGILVNTSVTTLSSLAAVGTVTSGTWSGSFGTVSGANLTSLTAGNLSGTIPSAVLGNSSLYVGTTQIALNRSSTSQTLTGISIDGNAATVTNGVYTTGSYADPSWITSLAYSKLTGSPSAYSLPIATASVLGGIKVGTGLSIDGSGVLSSTGQAQLVSGTNIKTINSSSILGSGDIALISAVAVASANGFAGSVSGTSSASITISTSITGLLKGNGTAISAAVSGTDYLPATSPSVTTSLTTPSTSFDLINTTATTVNFANAATTISIGASTGTTTVNNKISSIYDATFNSCTIGSGAYLTNIRVGYSSLSNATSAGVKNTAVGYAPLSATTSGASNTGIGYGALNVNSTGSNNTAVGASSMIKSSTGSTNTAVGSGSLASLTTSVATITFAAGSGYTASSTFNGAQLTYVSGTVAGSYPTANIVTNASGVVTSVTLATGGTGFTDTTTVMTCTTIGAGTGFTVSVATLANGGSSNVAMGYQTLYSAATCSGNVGVGTQALALTTGSFNTAIGHAAGYAGSANANTTGSNNVYVGYYALGSAATNTNEIVIGANAVGLGSNTTVIGTTSTVSTKIFGALTLAGSSTSVAAILTNMVEVTTVSATAATGTIVFYTAAQAVLYYTTAASTNWTLNITHHSGGTTLNNVLSVGQSITIAFLVTQGATACYNTAVQIDGTAVTPKWQGAVAPSSGNANAIDVYSYTVIKTAAATFTVLASVTKFG